MIKTKKQKRTEFIVLIVCIFLVCMAFVAQGQNIGTAKYFDKEKNKEIITTFPIKPIYFVRAEKDTITMGIVAYNDGTSSYPRIYVDYPIKGRLQYPYPKLKLFFDDGYVYTFDFITAFPKIGTVEYFIPLETVGCLTNKNCNSVDFENFGKSDVEYDKSFFKDFLIGYYKPK